MTLKKIENKLPQITKSKNYSKKYRIIGDLYDIIGKNVAKMKSSNDIDVRELNNIAKSFESVMKAEYMLDSEVQVLNADVVKFDFDG